MAGTEPPPAPRALLVGVEYPHNAPGEAASLLEELQELVENLRIEVAETMLLRLRLPQPRFLLGAGKAETVIQRAKELGCDRIVFDDDLSPAQQRNWERESGLRATDRQEVILDIFAARARTREACLQVELARLEYQLPRLRNAWLHLSRQRGGGVTQRGEGEMQIELDQRVVRARISRLHRELAEVVQHRAVQRRQRERVPVPVAALVGYTNAGKSSLLNLLTGAGTFVADQLFATLDPTTRQMILPNGQKLLVTDTVGFVRRLPHRLVEAFKATLEEAVGADLLLHVVDISSPEALEQRHTTLQVLRELGAEGKPVLTVCNKLDRIDPETRAGVEFNRAPDCCYLSCRTGEGLDDLLARLEHLLNQGPAPWELLLPHHRYDLINRLHTWGAVRSEKPEEEGVRLVANVPPRLQGELAPYRLGENPRLSGLGQVRGTGTRVMQPPDGLLRVSGVVLREGLEVGGTETQQPSE